MELAGNNKSNTTVNLVGPIPSLDHYMEYKLLSYLHVFMFLYFMLI